MILLSSRGFILKVLFFRRDTYIYNSSLGGIVNYLKVRMLVFRILERIIFLFLFNEKSKELSCVGMFSETRMTCT